MQTAHVGYSSGDVGRPMLHALARNWWLILLRGLCAIIFGALTFAWPGVTLFTLVVLYGAFAFVDGILAIFAAIRGDGPAPAGGLPSSACSVSPSAC